MLLLALVGGAAFLMLTPAGQQLWASITSGIGGTAIPAGLPVGTVRLANGQYRLPTGQIVGPPYAGQQPIAGSSTQMLVSGAIAAAPTLASWLARLFGGGSTSGGSGGSGGVDTPVVPGADLSLPLPGGGSGGVDTPAVVDGGGAGSIVLADGTVLDLGSFEGFDLTPISFGVDTSLQLPDLWGGGGAVIPDVSIPEAPVDAGAFWPGFTGYGRFGDMPRPKNPYLYDVPVPMMMLPGPR